MNLPTSNITDRQDSTKDKWSVTADKRHSSTLLIFSYANTVRGSISVYSDKEVQQWEKAMEFMNTLNV